MTQPTHAMPVTDAHGAFPAMSNAEQSSKIQSLRGVACLLLVAFHVIGDDAGGLRVSDDSMYRIFTDVFMHLRMPLFAFLSGFVYAYKPVERGHVLRFMRKKSVRLLLPLIAVSTLYFVMQQLAPDTNRSMPWSSLWEIYVLPYAHFWFLQAMLLLFIVVSILDAWGPLKTIRGFMLIGVVVMGLHWFADVPEWFSAPGAVYLAPFMLLGIGVNRFPGGLNSAEARSIALVGFIVLMGWHTWMTLQGVVAVKGSYFGTALSVFGVVALSKWITASRFLTWIGSFSFAIYLYHVFFSAGSRIVLSRLGVDSTVSLFIAGVVLAVAGSIVLEVMLRRNRWTRLVFLGQGDAYARRGGRSPGVVAVDMLGARSQPLRGRNSEV